MFSNFFELTILSAIQGISEFLPVSSSAHLILANDISNLGIGSIYLDTGMHLGSLLAVIFYFRNDLKKITKNKKLLYLMIFGSLPTIFLGAILYITGLFKPSPWLKNISLSVIDIFDCISSNHDRSSSHVGLSIF